MSRFPGCIPWSFLLRGGRWIFHKSKGEVCHVCFAAAAKRTSFMIRKDPNKPPSALGKSADPNHVSPSMLKRKKSQKKTTVKIFNQAEDVDVFHGFFGVGCDMSTWRSLVL